MVVEQRLPEINRDGGRHRPRSIEGVRTHPDANRTGLPVPAADRGVPTCVTLRPIARANCSPLRSIAGTCQCPLKPIARRESPLRLIAASGRTNLRPIAFAKSIHLRSIAGTSQTHLTLIAGPCAHPEANRGNNLSFEYPLRVAVPAQTVN